MSHRILFLSAILVSMVVANVESTFAEPPLAPLRNRDWFALRDVGDPGQAGETAAYLKVTFANPTRIEAKLWTYEKTGMGANRKHTRTSLEPVLLEGDWIKKNGKRKTVILTVVGSSTPVAAITYWLDNSNKGQDGKKLRVVLRFLPGFRSLKGKKPKSFDPCDLPPDDDILEEEPELPMNEPPVDEFDYDEDPYEDP